jgi:hypothetical protein
VEEEVGHEPTVDVASGRQVSALAGAHTDGDGLVGAALDEGLVGLGDDSGDGVDAGVEVGEGLHVVLEGLGFGAAEAGDGLGGGLVVGGLALVFVVVVVVIVGGGVRTFVTT